MAGRGKFAAIKTRILFVCLGNICRSPLAEEIFRDLAVKNNRAHAFELDSAGTNGYHIGESPDPRTVKNAAGHGIFLKSICRKVTQRDFFDFDVMVAMDDQNLKALKQIEAGVGDKVCEIIKLRKFDNAFPNADVPDPWYGDEKGFEDVFQIISNSCRLMFEAFNGWRS